MDSHDVFNTLKALRKMKKENQKLPIKEDLGYLQKMKPVSQQELRQRFQNELSKLSEVDTREKGLRRIRELVESTVSGQSFQMLVSTLTAALPEGNEYLMKVVSMITEVYGRQMSVQDLYRLVEYTMKHFKFQNVQEACGECWAQFYESVGHGLELQQRSLVLFQTLVGVISGGAGRQEQESAMVVLQRLYEKLNEHKDMALVRDSLKTFCGIYLKCNIDHQSVHLSMREILVSSTVQSLKNSQIGIVDKALSVLGNGRFNYRTRIAVCQLLALMGQQFAASQFTHIGSFHNEVIRVLELQTRDRIIAVQNASRVALKEWMKLKLIQEGQDARKMNKVTEDLDLEQIISKPIHQEKDSQPIVNHADHAKYVKKRSGTGGGHVWMVTDKKVRQSQLQMRQLIKNRVYNQNQEEEEEQDEEQLDQTIDYNEAMLPVQVPVPRRPPKEEGKDVWQEANNLYQQGCKDQAIEYLLREGDDIYLLRMLLKHQADVLSSIGYDTKRQLIDKLILVFHCDFINRLCLDVVQGYFKANAGEILIEDKDEGDKFKDFLGYMSQKDDITGVQCKSILNKLS